MNGTNVRLSLDDVFQVETIIGIAEMKPLPKDKGSGTIQVHSCADLPRTDYKSKNMIANGIRLDESQARCNLHKTISCQ